MKKLFMVSVACVSLVSSVLCELNLFQGEMTKKGITATLESKKFKKLVKRFDKYANRRSEQQLYDTVINICSNDKDCILAALLLCSKGFDISSLDDDDMMVAQELLKEALTDEDAQNDQPEMSDDLAAQFNDREE